MRDSRVQVWTNPTTISAGGTVNGPAIPLGQDYVGLHKFSVNPDYGMGFEIMVYDVSPGNDTDGFTISFKFQVAPDSGGSPGSYVDWEPIGVIAYDITDSKGFTKDGTIAGAALGLTRAKLKARLRGVPETYEWGRIVAVSGDLEGTATAKIKAWLTDGSDALNTQRIY